jgi:hypothetical protein
VHHQCCNEEDHLCFQTFNWKQYLLKIYSFFFITKQYAKFSNCKWRGPMYLLKNLAMKNWEDCSKGTKKIIMLRMLKICNYWRCESTTSFKVHYSHKGSYISIRKHFVPWTLVLPIKATKQGPIDWAKWFTQSGCTRKLLQYNTKQGRWETSL